ncbi:MAG TPA: helix-turn-helix domain-containing protein [Trueperaceae bacterium]
MSTTTTDHQILKAALETMIEYGYAGATTKRIAKAAGVNEVTLFRKFGSKAQLVLAALQQEFERFREAGVRYTGDLEADLLRVVSVYGELVLRLGRMIPVLAAELPRRPELRAGLEFPAQIVAAVSELLSRYQAKGALHEEPPMQATLALLAPLLVRGMAANLSLLPSLPRIEPHDYVHHFLRGRSPRGPRP